MPRFLLDTNVLLRRPELLSKAGPAVRFMIHAAVFSDLDRVRGQSSERQRLLRLINDAVDLGTVQVVGGKIENYGTRAPRKGTDTAIGLYLARARQSGEDLVLVTEDRD